MIQLTEMERKGQVRPSSKGNQLKWEKDRVWYKADYTGYEGLAEYAVSHLLTFSNLLPEEYVIYQTEEILYNEHRFLGCRSDDFRKEGDQLITLERLYKNQTGENLYPMIWHIDDIRQRAQVLENIVSRITGWQGFGAYLCKMMELDQIVLNEDRHYHNIALIQRIDGTYTGSPLFDHGAALLSDTILDYPITGDVYELMSKVRAKTISEGFDEQSDAVEELYGEQLHFDCDRNAVIRILEQEPYYPEREKERVEKVLLEQRRKNPYLFS